MLNQRKYFKNKVEKSIPLFKKRKEINKNLMSQKKYIEIGKIYTITEDKNVYQAEIIEEHKNYYLAYGNGYNHYINKIDLNIKKIDIKEVKL